MRYISLFGLLLRLILENPILQQIDNILLLIPVYQQDIIEFDIGIH